MLNRSNQIKKFYLKSVHLKFYLKSVARVACETHFLLTTCEIIVGLHWLLNRANVSDVSLSFHLFSVECFCIFNIQLYQMSGVIFFKRSNCVTSQHFLVFRECG